MASVQQTAQRVWTLPLAMSNTTKPLAVALATYPIQEALVSFLTPDDLLALTQVSQTFHNHIRMDDANAKANLVSKTLCPGVGFSLRAMKHCSCTAKTFDAIKGCAGFGFTTESRPCVKCGVNTCDECRIHVFYNSLTEDSGFDQRRWWAGFCFLHPKAIAVYPPKNSKDSAWRLPHKDMKPLHDQGRLHVPLNFISIGDPEPFERILDLDLGTHQNIKPVGRRHYPYAGCRIVSLLNVTVNKRKDLTCSSCYRERQKKGLVRCSCTLRKRFLDQWLCTSCYAKEDFADQQLRSYIAVADETGHGHTHVCGCGAKFAPEARPKIVCNWCKGVVGEPQHDVASGNSEGINYDEEEENEKGEDYPEEDHTAADFAHLPQNHVAFAQNHDQSLSVYVNGECIRGERLGRSVILLWMIMQRKHVDCNRCECNNSSVDHTHGGV